MASIVRRNLSTLRNLGRTMKFPKSCVSSVTSRNAPLFLTAKKNSSGFEDSWKKREKGAEEHYFLVEEQKLLEQMLNRVKKHTTEEGKRESKLHLENILKKHNIPAKEDLISDLRKWKLN